MKKLLLSSAIFFIFNNSNGQNVFQKDYLSSFFTANFYERANGDIVSGLLGFARFDNNGNILSQRTLVPPLILTYNSIYRFKHDYTLLSGTSFDTCTSQPSRDPFIAIIDTNGIILNQREYRFGSYCSNYTFFTSLNRDSGIISGGREEVINCNQCWTGNFYAFCTDSLFNIKWSKYYSGQSGGPTFGKEATDYSFLIGLNLSGAGGSLLKTDSLGNTIWCKSYFNLSGYMSDCLFEADGSCVVVGSTDQSATKKLFILKIDTAGNVLWCKGFDGDYRLAAAKIIATHDNNYMILGVSNTSNNKLKSLLIKTDKNGDTLWTKVYGSYNYKYTPQSIIQTADSGYLFGGDTEGNYPMAHLSAAYLYKTDSLGNINCNITSLPIYTYNLFPTDSDIVLTSVNGAAYPRQAYVRDTSYGPIPTYDDCLITEVVKTSSPLNNFKVHPNPSKGIIYIYRKDAYTSDCYYSVFDNLGKLLIQKIFPYGNKDAEIDLSRYGKGIYLIKITEGVESITKKVVIE